MLFLTLVSQSTFPGNTYKKLKFGVTVAMLSMFLARNFGWVFPHGEGGVGGTP